MEFLNVTGNGTLVRECEFVNATDLRLKLVEYCNGRPFLKVL